ncbi:Tautomerase enzyme [Rhizobium sp. P38BS-XIX]|uniref:tautomerase family protein n=1 Tax=Rhizobium sp. P38BS-XIX TaxID=2726740 RepID=UPI0014569BFE|nr:Tautomerase enzyme [Rhizobium sp. P38BS-XIX]NLR99967.1 Tautomerase enzyme [Rhizobium sp. P38BS-XIX]
MPMIDAIIPKDAFSPEVEAALIKEMTDILLKAEGFSPSNEVAQSVSVVFLHRPEAVYVGGAPAEAPRYRIIPTVPEGQYTEDAVAQLVKELTEVFVRAEGGTFASVAPRVWVFPTEMPDGRWGSRGMIRPLPDIQAFIAGEAERSIGEERLRRRRRAKAKELLDAITEAI